MKNSPYRGRRSGNPDTRQHIRQCARERFLESGYQSVTLRAIAADAGVDVALVGYYFGSKQGLFNEAMEIAADPAQLFLNALDGDLSMLGRQVLFDLVRTWDTSEKGGSMRAVMCESAGDPAMGLMMREKISRDFITPLARQLGGGPEATARAAAFAGQVVGVIFSRYILEVEPLASMAAAELVERMAPCLQAAIDVPGKRPMCTPASTAQLAPIA